MFCPSINPKVRAYIGFQNAVRMSFSLNEKNKEREIDEVTNYFRNSFLEYQKRQMVISSINFCGFNLLLVRG